MLKRLALVLAVVMSVMVLGIGRAGAEAPGAAGGGSGEGVAPSDAPFVARGAERYPTSYWAAQASQDAGLATPWLPVHVFGLVEEGLGSMGMARADLDFSKRVAGPQEHLLEPVRRTLDESLSAPSVAHGLVETPDPWVTLGVIKADRAAAVKKWCEGLDYDGLQAAILGESALSKVDLKTSLKTEYEKRDFGEVSYSYLVDYVNRGEMGAALELSAFTGSSEALLEIAMVAVSTIHELSKVFSCDDSYALFLAGSESLGHLMDDGFNGMKPTESWDPKDTLSSLTSRGKVAMGREAQVTDWRPVGYPRSAAEVCMAWPKVSRVLAERFRDAFERVKLDYEGKKPTAAQNAGELIQSGLEVIAYAKDGHKSETNWSTRIVIGGYGNDRHAPLTLSVQDGLDGRNGGAALLVDVGGSDDYPLYCAVAVAGRVSAVYDFGSESDTYGGGVQAVRRQPHASDAGAMSFGPCAAVGGCAVLEDFGGDDVYVGGDISLAAAAGGAAYIKDHGGSDVYRSGQFTQGAAVIGYAELTDLGETPKLGEDAPDGYEVGKSNSNDSYSCARYGQGFGFVLGVGRLEDTGGNDRYYAGGVYRHMPLWNDRYQTLSQGMGFGWRSENVAGGIGMLIDRGEGNDSYEADIYGQGSSYWYSLGVCWDGGGNDHYRLGHYGQGAGIHLSTGILIDLGGHDTYTNFYGVGTGGAHDYAVGWLVDVSGDDTYSSSGLAQGLNNSTAIFYDGGGDDCYSSKADSGIACGVNNSVALLIDAGGFDRYTIPVTNGLWHVRGEYGIVMDLLGEKDKPVDVANVQMWRTDLAATTHRESLRDAAKKAAELAARGSGPNEQAPATAARTPDPVPHAAGRKASKEELESLWAKACEWEVGTPENIASIGAARRTLVELGALDFLLTQLHHTYPLQLRALWGTVPYFGVAAVDGLLGVAEQANSRLKGNQSARTAEQIAHDIGRRRNGIDLLTRLKSELVNAEIRGDCMAMVADVADEREQIRLLTSLTRWESEHDALRTRFLALLKSKQDIVRKLAVEGLAPLMKVESAWTKEAVYRMSERVIMDTYFAVRYGAMRLLISAPSFNQFTDDDLDVMQSTFDSPNHDQWFLFSLVYRDSSGLGQAATPGVPLQRTVELLSDVSHAVGEIPERHWGSMSGWLTLVARQIAADMKLFDAKDQATLLGSTVFETAIVAGNRLSHPRSVAVILELSVECQSLRLRLAELNLSGSVKPLKQPNEEPRSEGNTK